MILSPATQMDLKIIILSEVSQTEEDKSHDITYIWNKKNDTNECSYKTETDLQRTNLQLFTSGKAWNKVVVRKCGTNMYTLPYLKWITNNDLLYSTGNSAQYYITT